MRTVQCIKLKKEAEGLDHPPFPGELGVRIWRHVSKEAWGDWTRLQTMMVNESSRPVSISWRSANAISSATPTT